MQSKFVYQKWASALLSAVMTLSMASVPAMAADTEHSISANYNGQQTYLEDYPENFNVQDVQLFDIGVGVDVSVTVNSGDYSSTSSTRPISMNGTLPNGTVYRLVENNGRIVSLTTTNAQIKDDIEVSVTTTPHQLSIVSNSGPKDFKGNLGSTSSPTCTVSDAEQSVEGNAGWSVTFTPNDGLNISHLNIRSSLSGQNLVSVDAGTATVEGTRISFKRNDDGAVTVSSDHAAGSLYITALTVEKPAQYTLNVSTDAHITSDVSSAACDAGTTKTISLTAQSGYLVDTISITDGGKTAQLDMDTSAVQVNGHTYRISRTLDGKVELTVPAMTADVSIQATASNQKAYLQVTTGSGIRSNYDGISYLTKGNDYTVRLRADDDTEITSVKIESATDSVTVTPDDYRFLLDGVYYYIEVDRHSNDEMTMDIKFPSLPGNLKISAGSKENYHTIYLRTDSGADYEGHSDKVRVEDGQSKTVTFTANRNRTIEKLSFTYGGRTYRVDSSDDYIRINGTRCPISWSSSSVTVTLYNVEDDITIKAITDAADSKDSDYTITLEADSGATYAGNRKTYVDSGDSKTVTFYPSGNHSIKRLIITRRGTTYRVNRDDSYVTINGTRNSVTWQSNGNVSLTLKNITADMTVSAETTYDSSQWGTSHWVEKNPDSHSQITVTPDASRISAGQSVGISVMPDSNYYLQSVTLQLGSTSIVLLPTTTNFTYNGASYSVYHYSDGSVSIHFNQLPADLTISSATARGNSANWTPSEDVIQNYDSYHAAYIAGIGNRLFAPYRTTTRAEALVMLTRAFFGATETSVQNVGYTPFTDVPANAWYASYLTYAYNQGILSGLHGVGSQFRPLEPITRAEYTELACRFAGAQTGGSNGQTFYDVPAAHWASGTIGYAASRGWVCGYGNGNFCPDKTITRAELVVITNRVLNRVPDRTYIANNAMSLNTFTDVPSTFWAYYDILEASNNHYCYNRSMGNTEAWGIQ